MYNRIRVATGCILASLATIAGSGMTLSYFTDTQKVENSFVIGKAETELKIYNNATDFAAYSNTSFFSGGELQASALTIVAGKPIVFLPRAYNKSTIDVYHRFRLVAHEDLPVTFDYTVLCDGGAYVGDGRHGGTNGIGASSCTGKEFYLITDTNASTHMKTYYIYNINALSKGVKTTASPIKSFKLIDTASNTWADDASHTVACTQDSAKKCVKFTMHSDVVQAYHTTPVDAVTAFKGFVAN